MNDSSIPRAHYSITEAAALLRVSRQTIWRWVRAGKLPMARLGHRTTRIAREDLVQLLVQVRPGGTLTRVDRHGGATAPGATGDQYPPDGIVVDAATHWVQFYEADDFLVDAVGDYLNAGLRVGDAVIVVATAAHRVMLEAFVAATGFDLAVAQASGCYRALDATETLAQFLVDGQPDPDRFTAVIGGLVAQAATGGRRVRIFGEMVALLVAEGNTAAAVHLEALWNQLQSRHPFALFCAYPMTSLSGESFTAVFDDVCAAHSRVIPTERYTALLTPDERDQAIVVLQQKAHSLEAALVAERAARATADAALQVRDAFLAVAAHELRTPLTTLAGRAQLALRQTGRGGASVPAPVVQSLQAITRQSQKLARLLTHLLEVSRLDRDLLVLEPQRSDLVALVEGVVAEAQTWSDRHVITFRAPPRIDAIVDVLRLEYVVTSLLENAVKFSPDGGPIEVVMEGQETRVVLSVRDHGLGIPPEQRGALFERIAQAHASSHRSGLGLGLYLARQIIELHNGEIRADFPVDGGTRMTVCLPVLVNGLQPAGGEVPGAATDASGAPQQRASARVHGMGKDTR